MTVKRIPSADSPGDFVGRGGLGAGGGRTYTGSTGGKSIVTGKKSSVSENAKKRLGRRYPESLASKNEKKHLMEKAKKAEQKKKKFKELKAEEKRKGKEWVKAFKEKHGYTPSESVYMTPTQAIDSQVRQMNK